MIGNMSVEDTPRRKRMIMKDNRDLFEIEVEVVVGVGIILEKEKVNHLKSPQKMKKNLKSSTNQTLD
jgi:hypothetical protein